METLKKIFGIIIIVVIVCGLAIIGAGYDIITAVKALGISIVLTAIIVGAVFLIVE